tara:strand:+ start:1426 stop:1605 length:180 start_codon:yes stop_codon:yes gene_type:complete
MKSFTSRSSKDLIIEFAQELIANQDNEIDSQNKLLLHLKEEKQALKYVLIASSSIALLF